MRYGVPDTRSDQPAPLSPLISKPGSLTRMVFDSIRDAIVSKQLPPNARLSEARLASQLNVSKTPVRESLLRLEHIGLAVADPTRGLRVIQPSREDIEIAYEVRAGLESLAARIAAKRADSEMRDRLLEAAVGSLACAELRDDGGRRAWDRTFHRRVAEAAANPRLAALIEDHYLLTWALRQRDVQGATEGVECARQHIEIAESISRGDSCAAAEGMLAHLNTLQQLVLAAHPDHVLSALNSQIQEGSHNG
jgi:DNA-binding GntR family transcriptional regulator